MFLKLTQNNPNRTPIVVNTDQIISIQENNRGTQLTTTATRSDGGSKNFYVTQSPDVICELLGGDYANGTYA